MTINRSRRWQRALLSLGQGLLVALIATTFSLLALWQWDRAEQHQELEAELTRIASLEPSSLISILQPMVALDGEDANRMVTLTGYYRAFYRASGQEAGEYLVGLLEVEGSLPRAGILVAREIAATDRISPPLDERVELLGRLLPSQREDRDPRARIDGEADALARIDSAILVGRLDDIDLALYDGYLLLHREQIASAGEAATSKLERIPDQVAEPTIPGYYWQHISYVVIWLLMAALTLYLPIYQRRRNRLTA